MFPKGKLMRGYSLLLLLLCFIPVFSADVEVYSNSNSSGIMLLQNTGPDGSGVSFYTGGYSTGSGLGFGLYSEGGWTGVEGRTVGDGGYDDLYTVGLYGLAEAHSHGYVTNIGVFGTAWYCDDCWAGYFDGSVFGYAYYSYSDARLKKNINDLSPMLGKVMQLKPKTYEWKESFTKSKSLPAEKIGLIAQDLEAVFPDLVTDISHPAMDEKGHIDKKTPPSKYKGVNYDGLIPVLIKAVQEQQAQIQAQNSKIEGLQMEVQQLQATGK